jgi:chromosome segregation ATPase
VHCAPKPAPSAPPTDAKPLKICLATLAATKTENSECQYALTTLTKFSESLQSNITQKDTTIQTLSTKLAQTNTELTSSQSQNDDHQTTIASLRSKQSQSELNSTQIASQTQEIQSKDTAISNLQTRLSTSNEELQKDSKKVTELTISLQNSKTDQKTLENVAKTLQIRVKNAENAAEIAKMSSGVYINRVSYLKTDLDKFVHPYAKRTSVKAINGR